MAKRTSPPPGEPQANMPGQGTSSLRRFLARLARDKETLSRFIANSDEVINEAEDLDEEDKEVIRSGDVSRIAYRVMGVQEAPTIVVVSDIQKLQQAYSPQAGAAMLNLLPSISVSPTITIQLPTIQPNITIPTVQPNIVVPTIQPNIVVPTIQPNVVAPTIQPNIVVPTVQPNIVFPIIQPNIVAPTIQPNIVVPTVQPNIVFPIIQPNIVAPTIQPNIVVPTVQPNIVVPTVQPNIVFPTIQPNIVAPTIQPTISYPIVTPVFPTMFPVVNPTMYPVVSPTMYPSFPIIVPLMLSPYRGY